MRFLYSDESVYTRYFHYDHLGSVSVVTDENGAVLERDSYDAWGKRRYPDGTDDPSGSITSLTTRGFTDQEMLAVFNLVHLNGRLVGRMMSADPTVPDPLNGQAWNRYSYVGNNPLAFTDPTGYSWLSEFIGWVGSFLRSNPIVGSIIRIAAIAGCSVAGLGEVCAVVAATASSAAVAGLTTGRLSTALKAGLVAGATTIAFYGVGSVASDVAVQTGGFYVGSSAQLVSTAGQALVGCASAIAAGGRCGPQALAGAVTGFAGALLSGLSYTARLVGNALLGGAASVIGGGKFADGAVTGAFAYLMSPSLGSVLNASPYSTAVERQKFSLFRNISMQPNVTVRRICLLFALFAGILPVHAGTCGYDKPNQADERANKESVLNHWAGCRAGQLTLPLIKHGTDVIDTADSAQSAIRFELG
jgi:RHS repeat-associated protein